MFCFGNRNRDFEEKVLLMTSDKYRRTTIRKIWTTLSAVVSLLLGITVAELCGVGKPYSDSIDTTNMTEEELLVLVSTKCTSRASSVKALVAVASVLLTGLVIRFYSLELSLVHLNSNNWREERPRFWQVTKWAMQGGVQTKKFLELVIEIFLCIINPVPGLSFEFLAQSYIFKQGQMVLNYRIENVIVVCMFPRLYHLWRMYRMWMFSKFFNQEFLRYMDNPTLNSFATIVPSSTSFAVKVALARHPVLTMSFSLFVFLWVATYLMRLAEAPFQTDIAENIWNPMLATVGYGDTTPVTYTGRTIAVLVMMFGALYVAAIDMEQWQFKLACLAAAVIQNRWRGKKDKRLSFQFKAMQKRFIKWTEDEEVEVEQYVIKRTSKSKENPAGDGGQQSALITARFDTLEHKVKSWAASQPRLTCHGASLKLTTCQDEQLKFAKEQQEVFHNVERSLKHLHAQILQMSSNIRGEAPPAHPAQGPQNGGGKRESFSTSLKLLTSKEKDLVENMEARVEKVLFSPTESRRKKIKVLHESLGKSLGLLKSLMEPGGAEEEADPPGPPAYEQIASSWRSGLSRSVQEGGRQELRSPGKSSAAEQQHRQSRRSEIVSTNASNEFEADLIKRFNGSSNRLSGSDQETNLTPRRISRREITAATGRSSGRSQEGQSNDVILVDGAKRPSYRLDRSTSAPQYA
ncbi:hypothetical protein GUITHDRAFT_113720 [Guillardia theta CCMP2712]|uniref:Potassium channel domain-containing protein n=1 Tax=Guillardia theta (strain CCMP2712) TaxID=905079 RepID=L1IVW3_GUITC|nr:hypothetical protein GUITHDRAFT_113720 [Guillardia theta CCMP2712]EKX40242.1 hypothetical protein GUITHDRAFT_113720 [Guillardia theta CCMP2712]|eukprot:XP_005827222.1 hypothetical protein GUITHDRAFT_113720 [Guillardia theta CCMP2712]